MGRLDEKVAIVTGGSLGIGAQYCKSLAKEGAKIVIADVIDGAKIVREIGKNGGEALYVETNVADEADNQNMAKAALETFGDIHIFVANAGLYTYLERKPSTEETVDEWDEVYSVNIKGVWLGAKAVLPVMKRNGYGKIVNIASTAAFQGTPGITRYAASKAAVVGMTRSMAKEFGDYNICINAIAPGPIDTETGIAIATDADLERRRVSSQKRALGRNGVPGDVVGLCVFLSSPDSDFLTGQTIVVDGGGTMW